MPMLLPYCALSKIGTEKREGRGENKIVGGRDREGGRRRYNERWRGLGRGRVSEREGRVIGRERGGGEKKRE